MRQFSGRKTACVPTHIYYLYVCQQAVVGFLSSMACVLDLVDVQCKVMVVIQPYLRHQVIQADRDVSMRTRLNSNTSRWSFIMFSREHLCSRHTENMVLLCGLSLWITFVWQWDYLWYWYINVSNIIQPSVHSHF